MTGDPAASPFRLRTTPTPHKPTAFLEAKPKLLLPEQQVLFLITLINGVNKYSRVPGCYSNLFSFPPFAPVQISVILFQKANDLQGPEEPS